MPGRNSQPAVLLLAYGSPGSLVEVEPFLQGLANGRPLAPETVAEVRERYRRIGGKSPLTEIVFAQAAFLACELRRRGHPLAVYVAMRHWQPRIPQTVARMLAAGVEEIIAIVLAPHASPLVTGRYRQQVEAALAAAPRAATLHFVDSWWQQPQLLQAQAEQIRATLDAGPAGAPCRLVFTAHSLPLRALATDDRYRHEVQTHAQTLARDLRLDRWELAWQSAAKSSEPWCGPALPEVFARLAAEGCRHAVLAPIGFLCDNVEILYDLDIEARAQAQALGLTLRRSPTPNVHPGLVAALADLVATTL